MNILCKYIGTGFYSRTILKDKRAFLNIFLLISLLFSPILAERSGIITGQITTETGESITGANAYLAGTNMGTTSNIDGHFELSDIPFGDYVLVVEIIGREKNQQNITVDKTGNLSVDIQLAVLPINLQDIVIVESRGSDLTERMNALPTKVIARIPARVTGELLREIPGVEAVRRGPTGLDPVVRGLRETEVGMYVDGTRYFPGGPGRMDSPLSHLDPSAIHNIQVVKGPYALTWGAGNLSAIHAETRDLFQEGSGLLHGRLTSGYHSNVNASEMAGALNGRSGNISYWLHGNWREGQDYEDGNGDVVPGDFRSREVRGKLGFQFAPGSQLILSGGYQDQDDMDYPGRLLDARFFKVYNLNARYRLLRSQGMLRSLEVLTYLNDVDHEMDNDNKPTAQPNENRMPPFPLLVEVMTGAKVSGGKVAAELALGNDWSGEVGGDIYSVNRDALRQIYRRDTGMQIFSNDVVWPDATIRDIGLFARAIRPLSSRIKASGTVRVDFVNADADTVSEFFSENVTSDMSATENNLSASFMLEAALNKHWLLSVGAGSVVRTADATERYADRFPSSKAQTSAEFVGNPDLSPERSTQGDIWLEAAFERFSLHSNVFYRRMDNYITLVESEFSKKLPLSPNQVFEYVNGDANFWGFESAVSLRLSELLSLNGAATYLWGEDTSLDEPVLGIAPLKFDLGVRLQSPDNRYYLQGNVKIVSEQDRVATTRSELPTDGYTTMDLRGGVKIFQNFELRGGILNLTDENYTDHLNAKNPFTGLQVAEPGRVFFTNLSFGF